MGPTTTTRADGCQMWHTELRVVVCADAGGDVQLHGEAATEALADAALHLQVRQLGSLRGLSLSSSLLLSTALERVRAAAPSP